MLRGLCSLSVLTPILTAQAGLTEIADFEVRGSHVRSLAFTADGFHLAVGDGGVLVFDLRKNKRKRVKAPGFVFPGVEPYRIHVAFAGRVGIWDVRRGQKVDEYSIDRRHNVSAAGLSPNGRWLVYVDTKNRAFLVDRTRKEKKAKALGWAAGARWLPSGETFLLLSHPGATHMVLGGNHLMPQIRSSRLVRASHAHRDTCGEPAIRAFPTSELFSASLSPDGRHIATVSTASGNKNTLLVSAVGEFEELESKSTSAVWWQYVSRRLAISHDGRSLSLWTLPDLKEGPDQISGRISRAAISRGGRFVAVSHRKRLRVYRIRR